MKTRMILDGTVVLSPALLIGLGVVSERVAQAAVRSMVAGIRPARPVCGRLVFYQASHLGRSATRLSADR